MVNHCGHRKSCPRYSSVRAFFKISQATEYLESWQLLTITKQLCSTANSLNFARKFAGRISFLADIRTEQRLLAAYSCLYKGHKEETWGSRNMTRRKKLKAIKFLKTVRDSQRKRNQAWKVKSSERRNTGVEKDDWTGIKQLTHFERLSTLMQLIKRNTYFLTCHSLCYLPGEGHHVLWG